MAKIDIPRLIFRTRRGRQLCYWNPSKTLREAGWKMVTLGTDIESAIAKAKKLNEQVEEWRDGGSKPRAVKAAIKRGTIRQLIARYRAARFVPRSEGGLAASTQKTYSSALNIIDRWAGDEQVMHISRARVRAFLRGLLKPDKKGEVHLNRAGGTMRVLHTLLAFAIDEGLLPEETPNPAANHNVPGAPSRDQIWSSPAIELFCRAALEDQFCQPSLALAIHLGREVTQRESDIIGLTKAKWAEIPPYKLDDDHWTHLSAIEPDGRRTVRGVRVRQHKTRVWVEVPVVGETRELMVQAIAQAEAAGELLILQELAIPAGFHNVDQFERQIAIEMAAQGLKPSPEMISRAHAAARVPRPWTTTRFQRAIADFRDKAAALARKQGDEDLAREIETLQFRDMRRTGVVWLGELGIEPHLIGALTGHKIDEVTDILERYMPRTTKMAGRAVVQRLERDPKGTVALPKPEKERG